MIIKTKKIYQIIQVLAGFIMIVGLSSMLGHNKWTVDDIGMSTSSSFLFVVVGMVVFIQSMWILTVDERVENLEESSR